MESGDIKEDEIVVSDHHRNEVRPDSNNGWETVAAGQPFVIVRCYYKSYKYFFLF